MPKVSVYNVQGEQVEEMELNDAVFGVEINESLMHQSVVAYLASLRRGTHAVKNRSMVSGGGRKPWRQKGTGRARVGSSRNPVWRGGGVAFGPQPRRYGFKLPKKARSLAVKSALSSKINESKVIVLDALAFEKPKTKEMIKVLDNLNVKNALLVTAEQNDVVEKSARNIVNIEPVDVGEMNTYNVLKHESLVLTKDAIQKIEEVLV